MPMMAQQQPDKQQQSQQLVKLLYLSKALAVGQHDALLAGMLHKRINERDKRGVFAVYVKTGGVRHTRV
jgi:hypothetical protein